MEYKKSVEKICGNCLLYNEKKSECRAAILIEGKEYHMPVFPKDNCHMEELGIPMEQIRWWVEDEDGNPSEKGKVKIEYPKGFFGKER